MKASRVLLTLSLLAPGVARAGAHPPQHLPRALQVERLWDDGSVLWSGDLEVPEVIGVSQAWPVDGRLSDFPAPPGSGTAGTSAAPTARQALVPFAAPPRRLQLRVRLSGLLDRHWRSADGYLDAAGWVSVGAQFDRAGDAYVSIITPSGAEPTFYSIGFSLAGAWVSGGRAYDMYLSVNPFRHRLANWLMIQESSSRSSVYERRLRELLLRTYSSGVDVGGGYRLFYYREISSSGGGARTVDSGSYGLALVYEEVAGNERDYHIFQVRREDILSADPVTHRFFGGRILGLRITPDLETLEIYED